MAQKDPRSETPRALRQSRRRRLLGQGPWSWRYYIEQQERRVPWKGLGRSRISGSRRDHRWQFEEEEEEEGCWRQDPLVAEECIEQEGKEKEEEEEEGFRGEGRRLSLKRRRIGRLGRQRGRRWRELRLLDRGREKRGEEGEKASGTFEAAQPRRRRGA